MSRDKIADNILNYSMYKFNDSEIEALKRSCHEVYKVLKCVFSKPRVERPVSSVQSYKLMRERRFMYPDRFYSFSHENVSIQIVRNSKDIYQIMCSGFSLNPSVLKACKIIDSDSSESVGVFRGGFYFYGSFVRTNFSLAVNLFHRIVLCYLCTELKIGYEHLYKQSEFIW